MAHCGYEPTAAADAVAHPLKAAWVALRGVRTQGEMAPEIPLTGQRPAQQVFDQVVSDAVGELAGQERRRA